MTDQTKIEWTDFTVNFWEGCQKVGPGCDHCYAEARDVRFTGGSHWGPGALRRQVKSGIPKLQKVNRDAQKFNDENGHWPRVFCSSLSDVFDNAVPEGYRNAAFPEIEAAKNCRIQLLTKRVGNVEKLVPYDWSHNRNDGWPSHVGLMITVVNQAEANRDIPKLLDLKARLGIPWVGLSIEPMLGPIDLDTAWHGECALSSECWGDCGWCAKGHTPLHNCMRGQQTDVQWESDHSGVDWVICGGESGPNARPMHPDWARLLRDQCAAADVPFLFKQWGEWSGKADSKPSGTPGRYAIAWADGGCVTETTCYPRQFDLFGGSRVIERIGKKKAGRKLDGVAHDGMVT